MEERRRSRPRRTTHSPSDRPRRRSSRRRRRRLAPGFVLNAVCLCIIIICLGIGGVDYYFDRQKQAEEEAAAAQAAAEAQAAEEAAAQAKAEAAAATYDFTLSFMGDINLDDSWDTMLYLESTENGITDVIDADLISLMQSADLFCLNNEFAFTNRGEALTGKAYTFRANPENVSIYETLGVDLVTLANNHIYDYGPDGLTDTITTLDEAGIAHVGAGETLAEASEPYYWEMGGQTIAFVNASCAERNRFTPEATDTSSGVLLCYETDKFVAAIEEAAANADYVVALVHWGTDYTPEASDTQRSTAQEYIDAGADVIVGSHSHCLQGIEYYDGKPIFYSLGTCWFNSRTLNTMMLQLRFTGDGTGGEVSYTVVPAIQENCTTRLTQTQEEWDAVVDEILLYSYDVSIGSDGLVSEGAAQAETDDSTGTDTATDGTDTTDTTDETDETADTTDDTTADTTDDTTDGTTEDTADDTTADTAEDTGDGTEDETEEDTGTDNADETTDETADTGESVTT